MIPKLLYGIGTTIRFHLGLRQCKSSLKAYVEIPEGTHLNIRSTFEDATSYVVACDCRRRVRESVRECAAGRRAGSAASGGSATVCARRTASYKLSAAGVICRSSAAPRSAASTGPSCTTWICSKYTSVHKSFIFFIEVGHSRIYPSKNVDRPIWDTSRSPQPSSISRENSTFWIFRFNSTLHWSNKVVWV